MQIKFEINEIKEILIDHCKHMLDGSTYCNPDKYEIFALSTYGAYDISFNKIDIDTMKTDDKIKAIIKGE